MSSIRELENGGTVYNGLTVNTPFDNSDQSVKVEDFLNLMIAQLTNQDFMNPTDDTQYVTQMAQFSTMAAMQELSQYSQTNYVASLVGKSVTVAALGLGGQVSKDTGIVSKVDLSGDEFMLTVNGKQYSMSQIMQIGDAGAAVTDSELAAANRMSPIVQSVGATNASIRWEPPVADENMQATLRYDVYYTLADSGLDFTTLEGVKRGTVAAADMAGTSLDITGLEAGKAYRINVVVTNAAGVQAIYQSASINTQAE